MKKPNDITAEKPREWWLHNTDSAGDVYKWGFCSGTFDPAIKSVHVIEYSAFSKTCEQLLGSHAELVELRSAYKSAIEERDAIKAQLAEVTRERNAQRQIERDLFASNKAERAKAERYREALEYYASCYNCDSENRRCTADHTEARKALSEAEGE